MMLEKVDWNLSGLKAGGQLTSVPWRLNAFVSVWQKL